MMSVSVACATALAGPVDLAPTLKTGGAWQVEQQIGKRAPGPDGKPISSLQTLTYGVTVRQGGRVGSDTVSITTTIERVQYSQDAPPARFDSVAGEAATDEDKIMAVGVGHAWQTWLARDGGTHVQQDRAEVETRAKAIGLPGQLLDLLLTGWTDEALGATVRDFVWDGPRDFHLKGDSWTDQTATGAALAGAQGGAERTWTVTELTDSTVVSVATFDVPESHVTTDGRCTLTVSSRLGGAPVERRTECAVTHASLGGRQESWLSYTWTAR